MGKSQSPTVRRYSCCAYVSQVTSVWSRMPPSPQPGWSCTPPVRPSPSTASVSPPCTTTSLPRASLLFAVLTSYSPAVLIPSTRGAKRSSGQTSTHGRTPMFGSQTPMYGTGSRTPMYGSQTPLHDGKTLMRRLDVHMVHYL